MTLALSEPSKGLDPERTPWQLQRLFGSLIHMQSDMDLPNNPRCHLCHSTVLQFLKEEPMVLCDSSDAQNRRVFPISRSRVADLWLRYLSQPRYATLMAPPENRGHDDEQCVGVQVAEQDILLPYCSKYWFRHLDGLEPTPQNRSMVCKFLQSSNFQTLLQAQSMFVTGHFWQFRSVQQSARSLSPVLHARAFPDWFEKGDEAVESSSPVGRFKRDHWQFVHEWGYLLDRGTCTETSIQHRSFLNHFIGEIDRCLVGVLGPANFLSGMKERYPSFMLALDESPPWRTDTVAVTDGLSMSRNVFTILRGQKL
jgi:hypothetical protein